MCSCCGKCGARCAFHYKNGDRQSCPSSCISSPPVPGPAPDMESIIAAALVAHSATWQSSGDFCEHAWLECGCGETWDVENEPAAHLAHQARAVLDAVTEAGD